MSQASPPDSSSKGLPPWLLFVFAVIGPPAAIVALARTITQNLVIIALLVIVYEVLVFALSLVGKIWQKLENPLVDHLAGWITLHVQTLFSHYRRCYRRYLIYEHQVFDVKGLSTRTAHDLGLEHVFVEVSIYPTAIHQASADPLLVPEHLREGGHPIWKYLTSPPLANRHLVIVGAPGCGKTTLLKLIALRLAQPQKYPYPKQLSHSFPVLLFLRDHVAMLNSNVDFSLVDAIQQHLQRRWQQAIPHQWFDRRLAKGKCLILLDGLDEVADPADRQQVADWVQRQMVAYGQNRFVITSRPYGYRNNPLDGVTILEIHPFTVKQIEQFVGNWYLANELKSWGREAPVAYQKAKEGAEDLLKRLHNTPALFALAANPLLLTMIATIHRYRGTLPEKRVALYAEMCAVLLGKRQEARGVAQDLSVTQKQQVLQYLAYHLMLEGKRDIETEAAVQVIALPLTKASTSLSANAFLEMIHNISGLFLEREPEVYSFVHLTFQEYLAAAYIKEECLEQILIAQIDNSWWHETIRLYCASADATLILQACLGAQQLSVSTLILALECMEEALKVQPAVRVRLEAILEQGAEDPDPERRKVIAEAILARRLR